MNIALDYDDTFTKDPALWLDFIDDAQSRGHEVYIVTARHPHEVDHLVPGLFDPRLITKGVKVIATAREPKRQWCYAKHNLHMHVWIDDMPEMIGTAMTWEQKT